MSVPELNVQLFTVTPVTVVPVAGLRTKLVIEVGVPEAIVNVAEPYSVVGGIAEMVNVVGDPELGVAAVRENVDKYVTVALLIVAVRVVLETTAV